MVSIIYLCSSLPLGKMIQFEYHVSSLKAPTGDNSNVSPPSFWDFKFVEKIPHLAYMYIHPRKFNIAPGLTARQKKNNALCRRSSFLLGSRRGELPRRFVIKPWRKAMQSGNVCAWPRHRWWPCRQPRWSKNRVELDVVWSNYSDLVRPHPKCGLVKEITLFQGNLGWWNIIL